MALLLVAATLLYAGGTPERPLVCRVGPQTIEVGAFYDGATVKVDGIAEAGSKVLVTVAGSEAEEHFNRKGRFGPIWLALGKVRTSGLPSLFLRFSSGPIGTILSPESISKHGLDQESIMKRMRTEPKAADGRGDARIRADYLSLKEADGTYAFGEGGVRMTALNGEDASFALEFHWPKKAPPAAYEVRVYEIRDRSVIRETSVPLKVVRTGFPAWLAGIADNQSSLYGVTAVLVGAVAGFGIDFLTTCLFRKKRPMLR